MKAVFFSRVYPTMVTSRGPRELTALEDLTVSVPVTVVVTLSVVHSPIAMAKSASERVRWALASVSFSAHSVWMVSLTACVAES